MKIVNELNNNCRSMPAGSNTVGTRGTKIELTHEDLDQLLELSGNDLKYYLRNQIMPRLLTKKLTKAIGSRLSEGDVA